MAETEPPCETDTSLRANGDKVAAILANAARWASNRNDTLGRTSLRLIREQPW